VNIRGCVGQAAGLARHAGIKSVPPALLAWLRDAGVKARPDGPTGEFWLDVPELDDRHGECIVDSVNPEHTVCLSYDAGDHARLVIRVQCLWRTWWLRLWRTSVPAVLEFKVSAPRPGVARSQKECSTVQVEFVGVGLRA
jgi:hypothetical protein